MGSAYIKADAIALNVRISIRQAKLPICSRTIGITLMGKKAKQPSSFTRHWLLGDDVKAMPMLGATHIGPIIFMDFKGLQAKTLE